MKKTMNRTDSGFARIGPAGNICSALFRMGKTICTET